MLDEEWNAKKEKKLDDNKVKERAMWEKLDGLNKKFKDIKKHEEQEEKKCLQRLFSWHCCAW